MNHFLYVIIPYFNYYNNKYRIYNIINFVNKYHNHKNIKIILVEALTDNNSKLTLPYEVYKHKIYHTEQRIWLKENLINLAIKECLPYNWNYVCWLDCDIEFLSDNWVELTIEKLTNNDIVQMFDTVGFLDENNFIINCLYGYAYIKNTKINTNSITHTGFAWGMTKEFYSKIEYLWEYSLIGSGDNIIANCAGNSLIDIENTYSLKSYSKNFIDSVFSYQERFKNCSLGYLPIKINTYYHGDNDKKCYSTRHELMRNFDSLHFEKQSDGLIRITDSFYLKNIQEYMRMRENDE